ncbi:MAG: hypothetical protein ACOH2K_16235 [Burkholderiaceae bacterium]
MNESKLCTIAQIAQFLAASTEVAFTAHGGDVERYAHISRVLKRFDYRHCNKHDRGVLLRYLQHTSGVRKAPCPDGRAGFVRIDSVHQGDEDGMKGVYHITCVDSISQW